MIGRALRRMAVIGGMLAATVLSAVPGRAELIITEVMYNPASTPDGTWEYVEVFNSGPTPVDLTGYLLDDDDGNPLSSPNISSGVIAPGGLAILHSSSLTGTDLQQAWGPVPLFVPVTGWSSLNNSGDHLGLWDGLTSYGARDYGTALDEVDFNNLAPWPDDDGVGSIYLGDFMLDNSDGSNWLLSDIGVDGAYASAAVGDNAAINVGSPGAMAMVPEPSTAVLLALGAIALLGLRRSSV